MYYTLHSLSLKLYSATIDIKHSAVYDKRLKWVSKGCYMRLTWSLLLFTIMPNLQGMQKIFSMVFLIFTFNDKNLAGNQMNLPETLKIS